MRSAVRIARAEPSIRATVAGALRDLPAVGDEHLHHGVRVEPQHDLAGDVEAADDAGLAQHDVGDRPEPVRDDRLGGRVAAAGVLGQGAVDHTVE